MKDETMKKTLAILLATLLATSVSAMSIPNPEFRNLHYPTKPSCVKIGHKNGADVYQCRKTK
jgi:hypothetical protein